MGIFWAIIGEVLIGGSLVIDKFLLEDKAGRAIPYVFWVGVLSIFGIFLIPFGFAMPSTNAVLLSFAAAAAFLLSLGFLYSALTRGGASTTLPIIGGFSPMAAYLLSTFFVFTPFNVADKIAFYMLVLGGFLLFFSERFEIKKMLPLILGASFFLGLTDVLQRLAFNQGNFISIFVTIKIAAFIIAIATLVFPAMRRNVFKGTISAPRKRQALYAINRLASGLGSFFIYYAFSQTPQPALIEALSGFRYVIIFIAVFIAARSLPQFMSERTKGLRLILKILATVFIFIALGGLSLQKYYEIKPIPDRTDITWGVTFSEQMSRHLGLDWKENFKAILTDLKPRSIRLIAYWDDIEPKEGQYDFTDLDWQMDEAKNAGTQVILAFGQRVPRWPECHYPSWVDVYSAPDAAHISLLKYITLVINRYKTYPNLELWQVENEPFLMFGDCPKSDPALIDKEVALTKTLDPAHKIFLTDGGEFGDWYRAAKRADVFAPTLYRKVHTKLFGYISWPLTPQFYPLHRDIVELLTGKKDQQTWISELGLEPWMVKQIYEVDIPTQLSFFNTNDFKNVVSYARQTGFPRFYTWGAEWWYYMKLHNNSAFWDMAKELFAGKNI